jgi:hypothetical protein
VNTFSRSLKVETPIYTGHNCHKLGNTVQYSAGGLSVGQEATYYVACSYLQLAEQDAPQLFSSRVALEDVGRQSGVAC